MRTLLARSPADSGVSVPLVWDGKDDVGRVVMNDGTYTWKALTSQVEAVDEGGMGDSLYDPTHTYPLTDPVKFNMPFDFTSSPTNVVADPNGTWYYTGFGVENGNQSQKFTQDGTVLRTSGNLINSTGIASDGTYVYMTGKLGTSDSVLKYDYGTGQIVNFTTAGGSITINANTVDPRPAGQDRFTITQWRQKYASFGTAVDSNGRLFVSNYPNNRVEVYDKTTGSKLGQFTVTSPMGIAVESTGASSGSIWVANNGNQVTKYNYTISGGVYSFTSSTNIGSLNDPTGITIGGPSNHLYVGVMGDGQIREYALTGGSSLWTFGSKHVGGALGDSAFTWAYAAGITIDSSGILTVVDDHRIQRFYAVTGGGHTQGEFKQSLYGLFTPGVLDFYGYGADGKSFPDGKYFMVTGPDTFEVDSTWTGGPRAGWLGDGTSRVAKRDVQPNPIENQAVTLHRVFTDPVTQIKYEFSYQVTDDGGMNVMAINPSTGALRHSTNIQGYWYGYDNLLNATPGGRYVWRDLNGDGTMVESEITRTTPLGTGAGIGTPWVDDNGNLWMADGFARSIIKIPFGGLDAQHNPIYSWSSAQTIIPFTDDDFDFTPGHVRVAANGEIFVLGNTNFGTGTNQFLPGGDWIAHYDSNGNRLQLNHTVESHFSGFALDESDPNGTYYYTSNADAERLWLHVHQRWSPSGAGYTGGGDRVLQRMGRQMV